MLPPIYVINLKKDVNRWNDILKEFEREDITNYERVDAVYGKDLSDKQVKENTTLICSYTCTYPMIGIGMSHLKTWETFLESGEKWALIFEDDVELVPNFKKELLSRLKTIPDDADLIYVGCLFSNYENTQQTIVEKLMKLLIGSKEKPYKKINSGVYMPSLPLGLHAYMISRKAASLLIKRFKGKLYTHIDYQLLTEGEDLKVYALNPNLASQKTILENSNNIISTFPRIINNFLDVQDNSKDNELSLSYKFNIPCAQIGGIPINALNIFMIIISIICGFFFSGRVLGYKVFMYLVLIYLFLEFIIKPEFETLKYDLGTFILIMAGFWIGMVVSGFF